MPVLFLKEQSMDYLKLFLVDLNMTAAAVLIAGIASFTFLMIGLWNVIHNELEARRRNKVEEFKAGALVVVKDNHHG